MCLVYNCSTCFKEITNKNKCTTLCNHIFCLECMFIRNSRESFETLISGYSRVSDNIRLISEIFSYNTGLVNLSGIESEVVDDYSDDDDDDIPDLIEDISDNNNNNNNNNTRFNTYHSMRYLI